jgi:hypothetical protein
LCYLIVMANKTQLRSCRLLRLGAMLAGAGACACVNAWAQRVPPATDPKAVVAETQQPSRKQGVVRIGATLWKCSDRLCIAASKKISAKVDICQSLAELVGPLARFGRVEHPMPSYDLALCNVRAQIKLARIAQEKEVSKADKLRRGGAKPLSALPPPTTPPVSSSALSSPSNPVPMDRDASIPPPIVVPPIVEATTLPPSTRPPGFAIRVSLLSVLGRGTVQQVPLGNPAGQRARIEVDSLGVVGHGRLQEVGTGTYLTVTVDKLEVIGK